MNKLFIICLFIVLTISTESSAQCDSASTGEIDEIVLTIENSLINAKSIDATMDDGTELIAFYVGSELVKLSVDGKGFMQEIFVSNGNPVLFSVTSFTSGSIMYDQYYFKNNRLVCRVDPMTGDSGAPPDEPETDLIVGFEYYLTAIQ